MSRSTNPRFFAALDLRAWPVGQGLRGVVLYGMAAHHFCWVFFLLNRTHHVMLPHSLGIFPPSTVRSSIEESGGYDYLDPYPAIDAALGCEEP